MFKKPEEGGGWESLSSREGKRVYSRSGGLRVSVATLLGNYTTIFIRIYNIKLLIEISGRC